jgi:hypothetical protein
MTKKKTGSRSLGSESLLGVTGYRPQRDEVDPEPVVEGVTIIRGPKGLVVTVRNPERIAEILAKYPGSKEVK